MQIDLNDPKFSPKQAAEITSADAKTIDNYIQHRHVEPHRLEGRRLFSALQLIEIDLIARLAEIFKIPPNTGVVLARRFVRDHRIAEDARNVGGNAELEAWVRTASGQAQATIKRHGDGRVSVLLEGDADPESIMLSVPVQIFGRIVMARIAALEEAGA